MPPLSPWTRRIAVTGLSGSGKTVFLLSLLQHLEFFQPARFRLARNNAAIRAFKELDPPKGAARFPRKTLFAALLDDRELRWPAKTAAVTRYRCEFRYTGFNRTEKLKRAVNPFEGGGLGGPLSLWWNDTVVFDFLDIPGERLADVDIARHADFGGWSDALLDLWLSFARTRGHAQAYLAAATRPGAGDAEVLAAYKRALSALLADKHQMVTPSTFALDGEGRVFSADDLADHGAARCCGRPGAEFAPLPREARDADPGRTARFAGHYKTYREGDVLPLFRDFNRCDRLLMLIDLPGVLTGGVGRYNDTVDGIRYFGEWLRPARVLTAFKGVRKVAFVGAKSDLVHPRDYDHLKALLDELMAKPRADQPAIAFESFLCSAWTSAEPRVVDDPDARVLRGVLLRNNPAGEARDYLVPEVPAEWPDDWTAEDPRYSYPRLAPRRLAKKNKGPDQENLPAIFEFLL